MKFLFEEDKHLLPLKTVEQKLTENGSYDDFSSDLTGFISFGLVKDLNNPLSISPIVGKSFAITQKYRFYECAIDLIVLNPEECKRANLTQTEIAAVIMHELGHIYNRNPEIDKIPKIIECLEKGLDYNIMAKKKKYEKDNDENFADYYVVKNGLKNELISCLEKSTKIEPYKMNNTLRQRISFLNSSSIHLIGERKR